METGEISQKHEEMSIALIGLCVNYGLLAAVMPQYPELVQEGFVNRMERLTHQMATEVEEIQSFGEAYDGRGEGE